MQYIMYVGGMHSEPNL